MSANIDYQNSLFQSIDTIVSARIANLPYDQTIECDIIDNINAADGEYIVQYQAAKFNAYSENKTFEIGDRVYVQVPKGDFNQDKIIISKKKIELVNTVSKMPFSDFARQLFYSSKIEYNFLTSRENQKQLLFEQSWISSEYQAGYTYLGLKFSVNVGVNDVVNSGDYGLQIDILGFDQSQATIQSQQGGRRVVKTYYFKTSDMIGANPFTTVGYINQTKLFDIKDLTISGINVYFIQDEPIIGNSRGIVINSRIRLTNIQLYFGYNIKEFKNNPQLFLYTADGLRYNTDYRNKTLRYRLLELKEDNTIQTPSNIINYIMYWGHYDQNSSQQEKELGWGQGYIADSNTTKIKEKNVRLSNVRSLLTENFILTIKDQATNNLYTSNILKFNNALYLEGSELIDILTGFQVDVAEEGYNGVYNIYGQDYLAIDPTATAIPHYFILNYYPTSNDVAGMQVGDIITWKIPTDRSMIRSDIIYKDNTITKDLNTSAYTKILTESDIENQVYKVPYYIKNYYSSNYTNNTIVFTLTRNGTVYTTSKELLFGSAGSQGNEYNIIIRLQKKNENTGEIEDITAITANKSYDYYVIVDIYNYNNEKIDISSDLIKYDYLTLSNSEAIFSVNNIPNENDNHFTVKDIDINNENYYFIIKVTITIGERVLEAYKSVALRSSDTYTAINGSTIITYDITGKKPLYNKLQFQISNETIIDPDVTWDITPKPEENGQDPIFIGNELIPPSIYYPNNKHFNLICMKNQEIIWKQPIYIIQNKYPGAMINGEGNAYSFIDDEQDNTINIFSAPMLGASKQTPVINTINNEEINIISGLYLGEITQNNNKSKQLLTYYNGQKTCVIDDEGNILINGLEDEIKAIIKNAYIEKTSLENININSARLTNIQIENIDFNPSTYKPATASTADTAVIADSANNYSNNGNIKTKFDSLDTSITNILNRLSALESKP